MRDFKPSENDKDICANCNELFFHCNCGRPPVDVVENKEETVIVNAVLKEAMNCSKYAENFNTRENAYLDGVKMGAVTALQKVQSQSIEGIVGFVLEYVAKNADYKIDIDSEMIIDRAGIKNMKSDIIKELKNGK